jgi:hypothetical protein
MLYSPRPSAYPLHALHLHQRQCAQPGGSHSQGPPAAVCTAPSAYSHTCISQYFPGSHANAGDANIQ